MYRYVRNERDKYSVVYLVASVYMQILSALQVTKQALSKKCKLVKYRIHWYI